MTLMLDHGKTILRLNLQKVTLMLDHGKTILRLNLQNDPQAGSLTLDPLVGSHDSGCKAILQSALKNMLISLYVCLI